jgi:hypothetical protein
MNVFSFLRNVLDRIAPELCEFNPFNLHPQVGEAAAYCDQRNWRELGRLYESLDHYQTHLITEGLSEIIKDDGFFDSWCEKSRGYYLPHLLRGTLLLKRAWVYRGGGRAHEVEGQRWPKFFDALESSFESLTAAMNSNPAISEAPARAIRTLMGLSAEWEDIDEMYARLRATGEPNFCGEINYLIASCEKWLGSHDKMFEFARRTYSNDAHPSFAGLIAEAHQERHLYISRWDDDDDAAETYLSSESVHAELTAASQYLLAHTQDRPIFETIEAHNYFALIFSLGENHAQAAAHYAAIGKGLSLHPWEFYTNEFLNSYRRKSLAYI